MGRGYTRLVETDQNMFSLVLIYGTSERTYISYWDDLDVLLERVVEMSEKPRYSYKGAEITYNGEVFYISYARKS